MPTWAVAISLVATMLSSVTFVGVPDIAFKGDLTYLTLNLGGLIAVFVVAIFFVSRVSIVPALSPSTASSHKRFGEDAPGCAVSLRVHRQPVARLRRPPLHRSHSRSASSSSASPFPHFCTGWKPSHSSVSSAPSTPLWAARACRRLDRQPPVCPCPGHRRRPDHRHFAESLWG